MPDRSRLVPEKIEGEREEWMDEISRGEQHQHHALSVFGEDSKVECPLVFDPRDA
jgi:hypothetical protein